MASRDVLHVLTEFRAGLMRKDGTKLAADPRRGLVRVVRVRVGVCFEGGERRAKTSLAVRALPTSPPSS